MKLMRKLASVSGILTALLFVGPLTAQAEDAFPRLTPELMDELNANLETDWPHDPAVPDLPPMPVTDDPRKYPRADDLRRDRFDHGKLPDLDDGGVTRKRHVFTGLFPR